ncbi:HdeD family acid-resistance protein [Thalassovita mangrovi]|uniref:HdeD family acid-resistance protein n=1 Tax=Thalassovita mangrovi TaxID=2692236 RepID=A0A6L8LMU4_9RHOB|nr:hypothetical protein [Thalassovita mangrovi]
MFILFGVMAILAPGVATIVIEQFIAWILILWGIGGLFFARGFRVMAEWRVLAASYAVVLLAGTGFLIFPGAGITVLTVIMLLAFFVEGALSILFGLRLSGQLPHWRWIVLSGISSSALGLIVLVAWTDMSRWFLALIVGVNFLSTGLSLLVLSRPRKA